MSILAQYAPEFTAGQLYAVAGVIAFILLMILLGRKVFGIDPPLHKEYATKSEIREAHGRIKREREEIDAAIEVRRAETKELRDKLEAQSQELNRKLDSQTSEINSRIDEIPGRTIALLRDTQQLHRK